MANPSETQKLLFAVQTELATLKEQVRAVREETEVLGDINTRLALLEHRIDELCKLHDLQRDVELKIVAINVGIDEVRKWKVAQVAAQAERTRRFWALTPNLTAAIVTIILAPLLVLLWNFLAAHFRNPPP